MRARYKVGERYIRTEYSMVTRWYEVEAESEEDARELVSNGSFDLELDSDYGDTYNSDEDYDGIEGVEVVEYLAAECAECGNEFSDDPEEDYCPDCRCLEQGCSNLRAECPEHRPGAGEDVNWAAIEFKEGGR